MFQKSGPIVVVNGNSYNVHYMSNEEHDAVGFQFLYDDKIREVFSKGESYPIHHWSPGQEGQDLELVPLFWIGQSIFCWNQEKEASYDTS